MGTNRSLSIILFLVWLLWVGFGADAQDSIPAPAAYDSIPVRHDSIPMPKDSVRTPVRVVPKVTPVDIDENKKQPVLHYYDKHGELLDEPVMFLATLDTVTKPKSKPVYPTYNGVSVGVNFGEVVMMAFGQKYGSYDVWADVSLWNWLFPVVEAGVGFCKDTPDNKNFTYTVRPSFYCKVGVNYNFLYKSDPAYQLFVGLRAAMSHFSWDATDISITSDYWQETQRFDMKGMRSTSFYGEVLAGIKVKIVSNFSLGWSIRYRFPFHATTTKATHLPDGMADFAPSRPWFVPGYGGDSKLGFTVSAVWTIPAKKKPQVNPDTNILPEKSDQSDRSDLSDRSDTPVGQKVGIQGDIW